jgi:glyoxylase-like metal-dependent hydrolase (beta-lactamase superfamily II)
MANTYGATGIEGSGLRRLVAPNPSPMTAQGTNTYVLGAFELAVIDPGPMEEAHLEAILRVVGNQPVRAILVTHSHLDHSPLARPLARRTGAPILAFGPSEAGRPTGPAERLGGGEGVDPEFRPDHRLRDGEAVSGPGWTLAALHTPGHMGNHMSFHWREMNAVFTGDTVMAWASTMISPPDGDLGQFLSSLTRLEALRAGRFLPGHGGAVTDPARRCRELRDHRNARSRAIMEALPNAPTIPALVAAIYADTPPTLHPAAARNVLAHLLHLHAIGRVTAMPVPGVEARWQRG